MYCEKGIDYLMKVRCASRQKEEEEKEMGNIREKKVPEE
jgi:hypothetical protein